MPTSGRKSDPVEVAAPLRHTHLHRGRRPRRTCRFAGPALRPSAPSDSSASSTPRLELGKDGPELVVTLVNVSPEELTGWDTNLYEVSLHVDAGDTQPFTLDNLPDSFRYDRTVAGYGVNGGVEQSLGQRRSARPTLPSTTSRGPSTGTTTSGRVQT